MKAVIQRVSESSVLVDNKVVGEIKQGLTVLLGVYQGDDERHADILAAKIARLRIFSDENDKMNLSVTDVNGAVLVISQFTLCADLKKGNRPSFTPSAPPERANELYEHFIACLKSYGVENISTGVFAAKMQVNIVNEGPVTILMDSKTWLKD
ncbi:MAG: D-tyrosyl-tRNA(Tyr) deacylase [Clostridiales bacterium]|nr:D-tyrosyl-tRNA(Tyr) deacylase [Clostridiales bacterium]